jgi:hypothetical protein
MPTSKKKPDPLGNVLGAPFKWLGGDVPAQLIGRGALALNGMDPTKEPYPNFFGELSDELVRPGVNAGKDFMHTWVSPLGGFYDPKKGYDFKGGDAASVGLSALSAVPIAGKVVKGLRTAAKMPKLNKVSKNAIRESMGKAPRTSVLDQFKTGYKTATTPGGVR